MSRHIYGRFAEHREHCVCRRLWVSGDAGMPSCFGARTSRYSARPTRSSVYPAYLVPRCTVTSSVTVDIVVAYGGVSATPATETTISFRPIASPAPALSR
jgi:hypothetical protein